MASRESDETPLVAAPSGLGRGRTGYVSIELSASSSSSHPHSRRPPLDHRQPQNHFVSRPMQPPNRTFFSGPLQRSSNPIANNTSTEDPSTSKNALNRFYSGPVRLDNDNGVITMSKPTQRRNHSHTNEHLLRSGPLGRCDDPYCTTCPMVCDKEQPGLRPLHPIYSAGTKINASLIGNTRRVFAGGYSWASANIPGIMNPHTKRVQQWNKFFVISCLLAVFTDPLFFLILSVDPVYLCIYFNLSFAKVITVLRSTTDCVYFLHMLLQCRLAYIDRSPGVDSGALIDAPRKIIKHYLSGWFFLDAIVVLPLPQIMMWVVIPKVVGRAYAANFIKNLLRIVVLLQYCPRMIRFVPLLAGNSSTGFIFETAWSNFFINLSLFLLVAHVVGSCWYLFGLQRVNQCLRDACVDALPDGCDRRFLDCGDGGNATDRMNSINGTLWESWRNNQTAQQCLQSTSSPLPYGIYSTAVNVTFEKSFVPKYIYSLFWGFQQISTLAGNQMPSQFIGEVLFVLGIVILGLLLIVLLIGNMQNFLLSLSRRRVDMQLRRHDVESWMARRHLPQDARRKVHQAERFSWAANRGVNEEELLKGLPEDIEKEIRKALCLDLIKKVRLFTFMEEQVLDAICQRLRQSLYIGGSIILKRKYPIEKMHFFVKGDLQSVSEDGTVRALNSGFCGEELLTWCLEYDAEQEQLGGCRRARHRRVVGPHAISSYEVRCLGSVEAFSLSAADLKEVTKVYSYFLRNARVQGAMRYESLYWRTRAATTIQVAWRYIRRMSKTRSFCTRSNINRRRHLRQTMT